MIDKPGIYEMSAEEYHADCCPEPSLSSSIAQLICNESLLHAWTYHHRLNPNATPEYSEAMDRGSICHALVLEGSTDKVHLIQAKKTEGSGKNKVETDEPVDDWRTNRAQEERDRARADGKYPILQCDWPEVLNMYLAAQVQLQAMKIDLSAGESEKVLVWQEPNGVWCRARLDWISKDRREVIDYKTTAATANPEVVSRTLFTNGYDIQEGFYRRGVRMVFGVEDARFRFLYQETKAPFAMSQNRLDEYAMGLGDKQVQFAIEEFGGALKSGKWPGYDPRTGIAPLPKWKEKAWTDKELRLLGIA